ncbi:U3 snoRNP protein [Malassezia sp. CBS 17886]|nr:U3 snoRNP protein [Malassezia sp. CBS 17886]
MAGASPERGNGADDESVLADRLFARVQRTADDRGRALENVDSAELFTLDSGAAPAPAADTAAVAPVSTSRTGAVWTDDDDARITVPLAGPDARAPDGSRRGTKRLRKLRAHAGESVVSGTEYQLRLRKQFERVHPRPAWAAASRAADDDVVRSGDAERLRDLLASSDGLLSGAQSRSRRAVRLPAERLDVERLRDANEAQGRVAEPAAIESVQFHPSARTNVLLTASRDRRVRMFLVNGTDNPLLETLHVPDLPVKTAQFSASGTSVLIAGPRPYLYAYDIRSGKTLCSTPWRGAGRIVSSSAGAEADAGAERDLSFVRFQPDPASRLVAVGGRRGQVHLLDWGAGAAGQIGGQRIGELRMNAPLAGMAWASPGTGAEQRLLTLSTEGRVHVWDMRSRSCPITAYDTGLFGARGLETTPSSAAVPPFWCIGSSSGIVNAYGGTDTEASGDASQSTLLSDLLQTPSSAPVTDDVRLVPRRSLGNLTTATTTLRFNHDAQLLAIASRNKKDALRMVHLPSLHVYPNWPTAGTPLGHVVSLDFSPESQYMAIGNSRGRVLLYSLRSYL